MVDQKCRSVSRGTKIDDLELVYRAYKLLKQMRTRANGTPVTLTAVAKKLKTRRSPHYLYRCISRVEAILEKKLFKTTPGTGSEIADTEIFNAIGLLLEAFDRLFQSDKGDRPLTIAIGTTQLLSARILPAPEKSFREQNGNNAVLIERNTAEPNDLLDEEQMKRNTIIFVPLDKQRPKRSRVEFFDEFTLHPCLLCPTGHRFKTEGFVWSELADETVIAVRDPESAPGYPWRQFEKHAGQTIRVGTILEGHSLVLAGLGVLPTHRELLTQQEEKYLEVIPLDELPPTSVALFAPKQLGRSPAEGKALHELRHHIRERFRYLAEEHEFSKQLSEFTKGFQTFWAVRLAVPPRQKHPRRFWVPSAVRLEATPSGYVRGTYEVLLPQEESEEEDRKSPIYEVFGRARQRGGMSHLICRATYVDGSRDDHGDVHFLFPTEEFTKDAAFLVGIWCGREAYGLRYNEPAGLGQGLAILSKIPVKDVNDRKLNACVRQWARKYGEWILQWAPSARKQFTIAEWLVRR